MDGAHQAVGDQAEVLAELALGVQLWEGQRRVGWGSLPAGLGWWGLGLLASRILLGENGPQGPGLADNADGKPTGSRTPLATRKLAE